ncbi:DUF1176 domain-containing protein [Sphingomonas sp. H39-1-10]|uniref:DUF1176 domain-containing protein n=1 Tax=Sphingomonas pollutisoli TaxID=3030829 RepID=UPI0023BA0D8A|nr:DUF1176 domain-containing protein [Sphingomonas pollutisoli]MDF0490027.1 DUF1176 domain-containing protein [Sphingomonas pollutisoli]
MRSRYLVALLLAISTTARAAPPPVVVPSYDSYQSWFVACDNVLRCVAKGVSEAYAGAEIDIERDGGPQGKLSLAISADQPFAIGDIAIDGKAAALSGSDWSVESADGVTTAASNALPAIRRLVAKLRNGSKLTLGGKSEVSLDGLAAAVLRFDERQHRIGGVTAIAKPGPLPASRVPASPPLPRVPYRRITATLKAGESARLIAATRTDQKAVFKQEDCQTDLTNMEPEAHALSENQALVFIPCIMGAYQSSSLAFIVPRAGGPAKRLVLPRPYRGNDPQRSGTTYFTNVDFDPKRGMLSTSAKGRALADCGMTASWIWNGGAFVIASMQLQQTCGGVEAGDWPTIFRSAQE